MKQKAIATFGFLKTTAVGGLIFLLPLFVIGGISESVQHGLVDL